MVKESNLILKVKFLELFKESLPVVNKLHDKTEKSIPPFIKQGCVFQVMGILKNTARIEVPEKIQVPHENWRRSQSQHKERYAGGPSKSYNVPTYITDVASLQKASILFLHYFQGMFDLMAKNAFESTAAEEKIKILLED